MSLRSYIIICITAAVLAASVSAYAGGPFVVDTVTKSGVAQRWLNDTLKWCPDTGDLSSSVKHDEAVQMVSDALKAWTTDLTIMNASKQQDHTVVVKAQQDTSCTFPTVDTAHIKDIINAESGPTLVIFDKTGALVDALMGAGNSKSVVGLSLPGFSDDTGLHITKGFALFNGSMLDGTVLASTLDARKKLFKASLIHELGHLLNLDHSQVNYDIAKNCVRNGQCDGGQYIPTMYPELLTDLQAYLHNDDKATLSWIYPSDSFKNDFCEITGEIFDAKNRPLKGVNVIAANATDETMGRVDARAFVSGALYPSCNGDSRYHLRGILPGVTYKVSYEPLAGFTGASSFGPLDNPPQGFASGTINSTSGDSTVSCAKGGEVIEMASVTIDTANPCAGAASTTQTGSGTNTGTKKSSCSLILSDGSTEELPGIIAIIVAALSVLYSSRSYGSRVKNRNAS